MKSKIGTLSHQGAINLCVVGIASVLSLMVWKSKPIFLGVALGGLLMTANFFALKKITEKLFLGLETEGLSKTKWIAAVFFMLKIVGLFLSAYLILKYLNVNTLAFGLSACALVLISSFTARLK